MTVANSRSTDMNQPRFLKRVLLTETIERRHCGLHHTHGATKAVERARGGRDHADGVLCSANVPRRQPSAAGSSLISLRRARHRRDPDAQSLIGRHNAASPVPRAPGVSRSEIKEEAEGRGTFAEQSRRRGPVHEQESLLPA